MANADYEKEFAIGVIGLVAIFGMFLACTSVESIVTHAITAIAGLAAGKFLGNKGGNQNQ